MLEEIKSRLSCKNDFEQLYSCYSGALYGVICREVQDRHAADTILKEVFIAIWQSREEYDESKTRLFTWMLAICYRHIKVRKTYQLYHHPLPVRLSYSVI